MSAAAPHTPSRGRRILVVSTNYAPELTGIGPYATQLAEHWAASSARTDVLTGMPHYPAWRTDDRYRGVWRTTETRAGVHVHRRRHYVPPRQTALRRGLFELTVLGHGLLAPRGAARTPSSRRCRASRAASSAPGSPAATACRTSPWSRT